MLVRRTFQKVVQKVGVLAQLQVYQPAEQVVVLQPEDVGADAVALREKDGRPV